MSVMKNHLYDNCDESSKTCIIQCVLMIFAESLFPTLNNDDSETHLLIGSKFTEGGVAGVSRPWAY